MARDASDAELMARVRAGDESAFARLVERHKDAVVNYLARLTGSTARAEDLAQETFLALYRHAARYEDDGRLRAYLFAIATNLVRSEERKAARRRRLFRPFERAEAAGLNGHRAGPEERLFRLELRRELSRALAALPLRYRVPVVLHDVLGWNCADIAELVRAREGTIKSRLSRGRERLRAMLEPVVGAGVRR